VKPVRLLWLIDSLNVGGAETLAVPFARRLDRTRYELVVCCLATIGGNPIEQELRALGTEVVNLEAQSLRDRAAFRRLATLVRARQIDLVHAHLTYAAIWAALLTRSTGIPSIVTLHVAPSATRALQASWKGRLMTTLRDRVMRFVLKRWATRVVSVSDALGGEYRELNPTTVHNGIELDRFARDKREARADLEREFDLPSGLPVVVTLCVLRPAKGIEVLLEAVRSIDDATFLIIGDGPMREAWTRLADDLGISERIRWAGYRRDVDRLLAACDLFVHPTLDDAFPTVLLEALAAGLPIVASRVGGVPEIVTENVTGRLVPPGDARALASAIRDVLADPPRGAAEAAQRFSTEAWIGRLDVLYRAALHGR
jgi:glycosyltransferase involved in cell wall biosynthesis